MIKEIDDLQNKLNISHAKLESLSLELSEAKKTISSLRFQNIDLERNQNDQNILREKIKKLNDQILERE